MGPSSGDYRNPDSFGSKSLSNLDYQHEPNIRRHRGGGGTTGDLSMDRILELNKLPHSKQQLQQSVRTKPSPHQQVQPQHHPPSTRRQGRRASDSLLEPYRNAKLHEKHMKHVTSDPNMRNKYAPSDGGHGHVATPRRMEMETLRESSTQAPKSDLDFIHERQHYGGRHQSHLPLVRDLPSEGRKRLVSFHPNTIYYTKDIGMDNNSRSSRNKVGGSSSQRVQGDPSPPKHGSGGHRRSSSSSSGVAISNSGMDGSGRSSRNIGMGGGAESSMNGSGHRRSSSGAISPLSGGMDGSGRSHRNLLGGSGDRSSRSTANHRGNDLSSSGHGRSNTRQSIKKQPQHQQIAANSIPGQPLPRSSTGNAAQPENHLKNTTSVPKLGKGSSNGLTKIFSRKKKEPTGEMRQTELRLAAATAAFASLHQ